MKELYKKQLKDVLYGGIGIGLLIASAPIFFVYIFANLTKNIIKDNWFTSIFITHSLLMVFSILLINELRHRREKLKNKNKRREKGVEIILRA